MILANYFYHGKKLMRQVKGNHVLHFYYDAEGRPAMVMHNGTMYTYAHSLQGDIAAIVDNSGNLVVEYKYDAWGDITTSFGTLKDTLGKLNPFRYRGYVYDAETVLYYLQSRYYCSSICRFINSDQLLSNGLLSANTYGYCSNAPVCKIDPYGNAWLNTVLHAVNDFLSNYMDTAAVGAFFLNMTADSNGVYHAKQNCWQGYVGYCKFYDYVFDIATNMKTKQVTFNYNGKKCVIWIWKGDYINLGAGAEMGIYFGGGPLWRVDHDETLNMSMIVSLNGNEIINWQDEHWWLTGFNPNYQNANITDITVTYSITFDERNMYNSFKAKAKEWQCDDATMTATYTF